MISNLPAPVRPSPNADSIIDLRNPLLAALLALILPGLGHLYQRRTGKAILYSVCILGTYYYGWFLGGRKVVYAAMRPTSIRNLCYLAQVWVGLPAWPAMIQSTMDAPLGRHFMVPPKSSDGGDEEGDFADWHRRYNSNFELGTVLTAVAGLLNVLAIFDAAAGPVGSTVEDEDQKKKGDKKGSESAEAPPTAPP